MHIIYKKKIMDQILEHKQKAICENREIEKIILTKAEENQLLFELRKYFTVDIDPNKQQMIYGIPFEVEDENLRMTATEIILNNANNAPNS